MELDSFDRESRMPHPHDRPVRSGRGDLEGSGDTCRVDHQRVVASDGQRAWQSVEYTTAVVTDLGGLSVHQLRCADNLSAKDVTNCLMTKAYTEHRHAALAKGGDRLADNSRILRSTGTGEINTASG